MSDIPVIDLGTQFDSPAAETRIAEQIDDACTRFGFFAVNGHGIQDEVLEKCWHASQEFFALSNAEKLKVKMPFAGYPYGFSAMEEEILSRSRGEQAPPDLKENFSAGPNISPPKEITADEAVFVFSKNQWPQKPEYFQLAWENYYEAMTLLSGRLMTLFALALKLPRNYFEQFLQQPISALRSNNYPALKKAPLPGQLRAGAHSDYGSLTLLVQEKGLSGLEIFNHQKKWIPVKPCKPYVIVNLGDLMERWTNGRWVSTIHRVNIPDFKSSQNKSRMSLAFFQQPDWDARIKCLPTCLNPGAKEKYPVITSGRHLMERFYSTVLNVKDGTNSRI
ncbi:MAG: isopenicillin N synthase family oxygenase [SAR324 cluster bacterium]|nr:isopenicillin N synthase family oxygenase [SAR324 cluster bacterium]MBL7034179.1 isopenicillin N synthase family oxygenase [SAR324 cluster bacterium]